MKVSNFRRGTSQACKGLILTISLGAIYACDGETAPSSSAAEPSSDSVVLSSSSRKDSVSSSAASILSSAAASSKSIESSSSIRSSSSSSIPVVVASSAPAKESSSSMSSSSLANVDGPLKPGDIKVTKAITYAKYGNKKVLLDLYQPKGNSFYPGVILVHGGGWTGGSRESNAYKATAMALAQQGYVVASVDYRLAGEAKFPAAVKDVAAAIRWMRANADSRRVYADKIAGIGGSAGGHLLAVVATTDHTNQYSHKNNYPNVSHKLQASIILGSGVDQVKRAMEGENSNQRLFFGGKYTEIPEVYKEGSPIYQITANMSPIYMIDGSKDKPKQRYMDFIRYLNTAGVINKFSVVQGAAHGQWGGNKYRPEYIKLYVNFLKTHLK